MWTAALCACFKSTRTLTRAHALTALADGAASTSGNSWSREHICSFLGGNGEGCCCCFHTDLLLHIFTFQSTLVPQQPKSSTSRVLLRSPPIQTEWPIILAQGEQMSAQITSFTLSYTSFPPPPPSLCSFLLRFHWLSAAPSLCCFTSSLFSPLSWPVAFPSFSCPQQQVNCLELLSSVDQRRPTSAVACVWETHAESKNLCSS